MKKKTKTKLKNIKEKKCGVVSARKWVRENDVMRNDRIAWQDAMPYEGVVSKGHEWNTDCGRYRIKRACQKYGGDAKMPDAFYVEFRNEYTDKLTGKNQWWDCIPVKPRSTQCKEFGCLQDALEAAEMLHRERTGREDVQSNAEQIRSAAKKQGLSELPGMIRAVSMVPSPTSVDSASAVVRTDASSKGRGRRKGTGKISQLGEIGMSVLSYTVSKTMKEIVQEARLSDTCYDYMKKMIMLGKVIKEGKGYKLKKL